MIALRVVLLTAIVALSGCASTTERPDGVIAQFAFISTESALPVQVLRTGVTRTHCADASFIDHSVAIEQAISDTPGANIIVNVTVTLYVPENCVLVSGDVGRVE